MMQAIGAMPTLFVHAEILTTMNCAFIIYTFMAWMGSNQPPAIATTQNLIVPEKVCELPAELFEVSGLTDVDDHTVACVNDENGTIYFYDFQACAITKKMSFGGLGDYEGLTRVGKNFYCLRSDGMLYEILEAEGGKAKVKQAPTNVPAANNEGLGYDEKMNRLLIAPKAKYRDASFEKQYRAVYAYDIETGKMSEKPVLQINVKEAGQFLAGKASVNLPKHKKTGEINFKFDISSIAVNPATDQYYLLVNSAHLVLVVNRQGQLEDVLTLDEKTFPQPEGITFLNNNKLVISSEGAKGKPTIGVFEL